MTKEELRIMECDQRKKHWKRWGPYLSERAWGTVREDYSATGDAWDYFPHDHARSRAYRWNEDGIAGICDRHQRSASRSPFGTERPILKERLFGLTGRKAITAKTSRSTTTTSTATPTHSYMKYLYKYPHAAYPYEELARGKPPPSKSEPEYELIDTGIFDDDRYFDVFIEYAKADAEDILIASRGQSRSGSGPIHAAAHPLVSQHLVMGTRAPLGPAFDRVETPSGNLGLDAVRIATSRWLVKGAPELLFTENETNCERLLAAEPDARYVKDGIPPDHHSRLQRTPSTRGHGNQGGGALPCTHRGRGKLSLRLRLTDQTPNPRRLRQGFRRSFRGAQSGGG